MPGSCFEGSTWKLTWYGGTIVDPTLVAYDITAVANAYRTSDPQLRYVAKSQREVGEKLVASLTPAMWKMSVPVSLPGPLAGDDDLWLPMRMTPDERINESSHNYKIMGRLRGGVTLEQGRNEERTRLAQDLHDILRAKIV